MSFGRYPKYKDSGVEWLGEVPEHWRISRLKHATHLCMGQSPPSEQYNIDGIGVPFLQGCAEFSTDHPIAEKHCDAASKVTEVGDLLFSVRAPVGRLNVADKRYGIGRGLCGIRPRSAYSNRFLFYWLHEVTRSLQAVATGSTYEAVSVDQVACAVALVPEHCEQTAIAAFLDRETGKIDALIAEQRRLIELLQEKRQAVISHAVTKGLNPDAPMKDSGIEWLGMVPEHWIKSKPKFVTTKIVDGVHFKPDYVPEGIPFVTVQNLTANDGITFDNLNYITAEAHEEYYRRANPEKGDVLLTKDGATLGVARVIETDQVFSIFVSVALLKPVHSRLDPWFLRFAVESSVVFQQFKAGEQGSGLKHIHLVDLRNVVILLPPLKEQREIVRVLHVRLGNLKSLCNEAERAITILQERRSALISAAVTGQIDVRHLAETGAA
jgi:type I restriction enzyme S subunit